MSAITFGIFRCISVRVLHTLGPWVSMCGPTAVTTRAKWGPSTPLELWDIMERPQRLKSASTISFSAGHL